MLNRPLLGGLTGTQIPIKSCCPSQMPLCCPTLCPVVILCFITALTLLYRAKGNVIYPIPSWNRKNKHLLSISLDNKSVINSYSVCKWVKRLSVHGLLV